MAQKRGTLARKLVSTDMSQALNRAADMMKDYRKQTLTPEMVLLAFVDMPDLEAHQLLRRFSREQGFDWKLFSQDVARNARNRIGRDVKFDFVSYNQERIALSNEMLEILDEGLSIAEKRGETWLNTMHALAVMADPKVETYRLLNERRINRRAVIAMMGEPSLASGAAVVDFVARAKQGELPAVHRREELLQNLENLLAMMHGRHIILTGSSGVGRRSLVLALAHHIAEGRGLSGLKSVVQMNEQSLLDKPTETLLQALGAAKEGILFIPDIARFFGGPRRLPEFPDSASNALQKAFLQGQPVIVGTATDGQYRQQLLASSAVAKNSQSFNVPPATIAETVDILKVLREGFQRDYALNITTASLEETARLAGRYYGKQPLPSSAVYLLHRACAMFRVSSEGEPLVTPDGRLDVEDVRQATSMLTGIPMANMEADERERYLNMEAHLHKRIIGQKEAVEALSKAVKIARVGLKDPKRPIGSFLFLGPTGVGKSELAKALAEFMFGTEDALITLDMSEFMEESSVNRLIGSPPGYTGHDAGGQLTDAVRDNPYSVVLFDEIEKAAVKVFDVLLQVLDEGRLTSGQGETVSFSETVILLTSNIGSHYLAAPELTPEEAHASAEAELKQRFRPEFLNRLDDIVYFHRLSDDDLYKILELMLNNEYKILIDRKLMLQVPHEVKMWLLSKNEHPEWGARPLRRIIQRYVREPLANFLLRESPPAGMNLEATINGDELDFVAKPAA